MAAGLKCFRRGRVRDFGFKTGNLVVRNKAEVSAIFVLPSTPPPLPPLPNPRHFYVLLRPGCRRSLTSVDFITRPKGNFWDF
jgi:hypothetical protein